MSKGNFVSELPCERLVRDICGSQWRNLPKQEIDAAWGVAIVHSVLNGVRPVIYELARHLGVDSDTIADAYFGLNSNGVFKRGWLEKDRESLESGDIVAWCYYGGYACGATSLR